MIGSVCAVPVTDAVTNSKTTEVTFNSHGGVAPCWYSWGVGTNMYWSTPNQTTCGSDYQLGSPMLTGQTYNVKACDSTGCGNVVSWAVPAAEMLPQTHFGDGIMKIWRSGFNITETSNMIIEPYIAPFVEGTILTNPTLAANAQGILIGVLFFFIYAGFWLRGQGIGIPCFMAILSFVAIFAAPGIGMNVPDEFKRVGLMLLIVGVAGLLYSWISNK